MSVRVIARVRPLLKSEIERDVIVTIPSNLPGRHTDKPTVRIPNPRNESEAFSFQFNSVYDRDTTQAQLYDQEVAPTVKHLFKGYDVTLFAYGITGTGKTHTMRGGKSLADRGVIPRLLSSIFRYARKLLKDSEGNTDIEVVMSYYEIYNDRVYDLFESPEKRTAAGLPIRDNNGKTVVVGLTERPCTTLKDFEKLYDEANLHRSTSATKLNAHSSRSHAILCVKVIQTIGTQVRISTVSAIDLAGSEDNRRTDNNKDRLVESASINKSLFVLAQCVEAISKKQSRIPYRESKMTRILSLGQNKGLTVMILNLAPVRSYHLDTLSSLNFANRTKKIDVNEIENQPFYRDLPGKDKPVSTAPMTISALSFNRQPLRPKILSHDSHLGSEKTKPTKPIKEFVVFQDTSEAPLRSAQSTNINDTQYSLIKGNGSTKRITNDIMHISNRPSKLARTSSDDDPASLSRRAIEALVERKVNQALAERVDQTNVSGGDMISEEVQRRLDSLERRIEGQDSERAQGLHFLLMAKQHQAHAEHSSALTMYRLALPFFPGNEKLERKVAVLQNKVASQKIRANVSTVSGIVADVEPKKVSLSKKQASTDEDESCYEEKNENEDSEDDDYGARPRNKMRRPQLSKSTTESHRIGARVGQQEYSQETPSEEWYTPRTQHILDVVNSKDVSKIQLLKGIGAKKAELIVNTLCEQGDERRVLSLYELSRLRGVGDKTIETIRMSTVV